MLRRLFLWLSERQGVFRLVKRNGLARGIAGRYVAGETIASAVAAARQLNGHGISASLDLLGESVRGPEAARQARDAVLDTLDAIAESGVDASVSVKLTQLGLDVSQELCDENMRAVLTRAEQREIFVRADMESSAYTERTLRLFLDSLQPTFGERTGVVIQSCLRRSATDVEVLIASRARVRLCKGAYAEPAEVAYPDKRDVDASFATLMERLLEAGNYPALATHDEQLIDRATRFASARAISRARFEFQMLYGVRRDLQGRLRHDGYRVRVYVPFGTAWYPYLMRRLAERPANLRFFIASYVKETVARR